MRLLFHGRGGCGVSEPRRDLLEFPRWGSGGDSGRGGEHAGEGSSLKARAVSQAPGASERRPAGLHLLTDQARQGVPHEQQQPVWWPRGHRHSPVLHFPGSPQ